MGIQRFFGNPFTRDLGVMKLRELILNSERNVLVGKSIKLQLLNNGNTRTSIRKRYI
jgi:hypothetical protein